MTAQQVATVRLDLSTTVDRVWADTFEEIVLDPPFVAPEAGWYVAKVSPDRSLAWIVPAEIADQNIHLEAEEQHRADLAWMRSWATGARQQRTRIDNIADAKAARAAADPTSILDAPDDDAGPESDAWLRDLNRRLATARVLSDPVAVARMRADVERVLDHFRDIIDALRPAIQEFGRRLAAISVALPPELAGLLKDQAPVTRCPTHGVFAQWQCPACGHAPRSRLPLPMMSPLAPLRLGFDPVIVKRSGGIVHGPNPNS